MKLLSVLFLFSGLAAAQQINPSAPVAMVPQLVSVDPSGACSNPSQTQFNYKNGATWTCVIQPPAIVGAWIQQNYNIRDIVSVKAYCATVDGSTDNTACMQSAVAAMDATGGGTLLFPPGTYRGSITLPETTNCVNIVGAGDSVSIIKANASVSAVILKGATTKPIHCNISDITVDGNKQATYGMLLQEGKDWSLERLRIIRPVATTGEGLRLGTTNGANPLFYEAHISTVNVEFDSSDYLTSNRPVYGIHFLASATDNTVSDCRIWNPTTAGIKDEASAHNQIINHTHVYGFPIDTYDPTYGIETSGTTLIDGFHADGFGTAGVHVTGNFVTITNSVFTQPSGSAITNGFPVLASAGVDYLIYTDNTISNIGNSQIAGVTTAVSWNGTIFPSNNSLVSDYTGLSSPNYFLIKGAYVYGEFSPVGTITAGPVYNDKPTLTLKTTATHTAEAIRGEDHLGATTWTMGDDGTLTMPGIKSTTGTRFVCVDTTGKITSSVTACSGT